MNRKNAPFICVKNLTIAYDDNVVVHDLNFNINRGDIFVIMGMSGCGKSTIMRSMIGLLAPQSGEILIDGVDMWAVDDETRNSIISGFGVSYQSGALFSSMTVWENVALPLQLKTDMTMTAIEKRVRKKLDMVGLDNSDDLYPSEISGGMVKRASLARAMVMEPRVLFFDEPTAGLDPVRSAQLDKIILDINHKTGTTIVMVTHDLSSIMNIATNSVYIDINTRTVGAYGAPHDILKSTKNNEVKKFLRINGGQK
jgi:phospholipid/cholesterol/gamma-HCH transport system ATP-binding protein